MTYALVGTTVAAWVLLQGAGLDLERLAASVCDLGMVPGEVTRRAPLGQTVPLGQGLVCVIDNQGINVLTPLLSMFLHGGWGHLLGNLLYLWVFGNNVEDVMGRVRFLVFYVICGLAAAFAHVVLAPASPVPTVGASGAISGVMGAYLLLYPHARVRTFFPPLFLFHVRAWVVLLMWFGTQVLAGLPQLTALRADASGGVAVWAHVGGFVAGVALVRLFADAELVRRRRAHAPLDVDGGPGP
jgi:membrane associated rhomboid family serine protease